MGDCGSHNCVSTDKKKKKKKVEAVKFLDGKRSQNCEIALSRFKCSFEEIRDGVVNMDVRPMAAQHTPAPEQWKCDSP